jgi:hypothetical protein
LDEFRAIQTRALADVLRGQDPEAKQDPEYVLRGIHRWYSEKYHTPLHQVDDLPLEDVLRHYYEDHYEALAKDDPARLDAERRRLSMTEEELRRARWEEDAADADAEQYRREVEAEEAAEKEKTVIPSDPAPRTAVELPPDVHMTFPVDDLERDALEYHRGQSS